MSVLERPVGDPVRCSSWSRGAAIDPIGTAGYAEALAVVELPLPWPPRVDESPALAPLFEALSGTRVQVQAVVPSDPQRSAVRVAVYRGAEGPGYHMRETSVPAAEVVAAVQGLLGGDAPANRPDGEGAGELLLCGHGRRDRCCGSLGTELALRLEASGPLRGRGGAYRVRRTSHTGGHRFAPTGIVLPEGTLWGFLDDGLLARIIGRSGEVADVLPRYRGYLRLSSPELQALEREVLGAVGWDLFDAARTGEQVGEGRYALHAEWPGGATMTWSGDVRPGRTLPVPVCGAPIEDAVKHQTELVVDRFGRAD